MKMIAKLRPGSARPDPTGEGRFEDYVGRRAESFRRRLIAVAALAVAAVVAVSVGLALREYRHAKHSALNDLRSRAVVAAAVVNTAFAGDVSTLDAVAGAPAIAEGDQAAMLSYFRRIESGHGLLFNGGIGWIDRAGVVRVSTTTPPSKPPLNVSDRTYFRRVLASGRPYVSAGLIGRRIRTRSVVVAVPTRGANGRISGVLAASIQLRAVKDSKSELELGYQGLEVVDRNGHMLLTGLVPVRNAGLLVDDPAREHRGRQRNSRPRRPRKRRRGVRDGDATRLEDRDRPQPVVRVRRGDCGRSSCRSARSPRPSSSSSAWWRSSCGARDATGRSRTPARTRGAA